MAGGLDHHDDAWGSRLSFYFTVSMVIFAVTVVLSFSAKRPVQSGYHWLEGLSRLRRAAYGNTRYSAWPFRESGKVYFPSLLRPCFVATDQESKLGQFALITSAVSLVSYWACGKWFKPKFRKTGMLVGSILMPLVILPSLVAVNYTTPLVLGIGTSLFIPLYMMPAISASFDLMGVNQENVEKRVELVVLRELSLTIGRITGLLVFILVLSFRQDTLTVTLSLLFLGHPLSDRGCLYVSCSRPKVKSPKANDIPRVKRIPLVKQTVC